MSVFSFRYKYACKFCMKLVDMLTIGTVVISRNFLKFSRANATQPGLCIGGNMTIDWSVICVIINF